MNAIATKHEIRAARINDQYRYANAMLARQKDTSTRRSEACGVSRKLGNLASSLQANLPADTGLLGSRLPPRNGNSLLH